MAAGLSPEQQQKVEQLSEAVADRVQANPELKQWCTATTLQRYLRARNWDVAAATKMLRNSLEWRMTYRPHDIRWEDIQEEAKTGKTYVGPHADYEGRPVVVMRPRNENSKVVERQLKFLVYQLELASRKADEAGVEKMTWLIDFVGYSMRNAPPIKLSMHALHLLQSHYPERLGLAVCYLPPLLFSLTWKATSPFIDPLTYRKIHFVDKGAKGSAFMAERFGGEQLEECMGGHNPWVFEYESHGAEMREEDAKLQRAIQAAASA